MEVEDFELKVGPDVVPWRLFTPDGADKEFCVLWVQGWSSSMDSHREGVERMAEASGTVFATLDHAGHGLSKTTLDDSTREQQVNQLVAVFDELQGKGFKKIIVIGVSFGGYMTAMLTGQRPVHSAVLRAPANYPDDEYTTQYKDTLRSKDYAAYSNTKDSDAMINSMATKALAAYDGFTYIMEHELDDIVPAKVPKRYYEVTKHGNYLVIPRTKHSVKDMKDARAHYDYIEHFVVATIAAVKMQETLGTE